MNTGHMISRRNVVIAAAVSVCVAFQSVATGQFPGHGERNARSKALIESEWTYGAPAVDDPFPLIERPKPGDRIQLNQWSFGPGGNLSDPLTQIVRIIAHGDTEIGASGTGFLFGDCRIMTNLHVVVAAKEVLDNIPVKSNDSLVVQEFDFISAPIPWRDNAAAQSRMIILGHGDSSNVHMKDAKGDEKAYLGAEDWAIGYDLACASQRYRLGTLQMGENITQTAMASFRTFTAGYTGFKMQGLSRFHSPLYIDSDCRVTGRGMTRDLTGSVLETDCSASKGGSGQPFMGLVTDPKNRSMFLTDDGRPRLIALGVYYAGTGIKDRGYTFISFNDAKTKDFAPYVRGTVNLAAIRKHRPPEQGGPRSGEGGFIDAELISKLSPRYTEDAWRRRVEGRAQFELQVLRDGRVGNVKLIAGVDPGLDALLLSAAKEWFFMPATRNGVPVEVTKGYAFNFRIPPPNNR